MANIVDLPVMVKLACNGKYVEVLADATILHDVYSDGSLCHTVMDYSLSWPVSGRAVEGRHIADMPMTIEQEIIAVAEVRGKL